ncbi:MAG: Nif3-like dinuclear metal center hexameric protein [Balneolaceae bacterium]|nr:Nif3-like dinuclear metal center hexameric protein [Balneolaceae bacterium]MDR9446474.1 Nif3-like dinuclear metal center hexameric protein [Balneolaceae bacterium]
MSKPTVADLKNTLETWAPPQAKLDYDNIGYQVGTPSKEVSKALICLDVTPEVIQEAVELGAECIVSHHPILFKKPTEILTTTFQGDLIHGLIEAGCSLITAHTNLDAAPGGVSFKFAEKLGLEEIEFLRPFEVAGQAVGFGAVGSLAAPMNTEDFTKHVAGSLGQMTLRTAGGYATQDDDFRVERVAVCGGSGSSLLDEISWSGIDAFVTADVTYHRFFVEHPSLFLVDVGHYESEMMIIEAVREYLSSAYPTAQFMSTKIQTNPVTYHSF